MINLEDRLFTVIAAAIRKAFPNALVTGEYVQSPAQFPAVSIVEIDNSVYRRTQTNVETEHDAAVVYEVNIYSNKTRCNKAECKSIAAAVDAEFKSMGFTRIMLNPIQNLNDASIYRMTGRYRAVVGVDANGDYIIHRR